MLAGLLPGLAACGSAAGSGPDTATLWPWATAALAVVGLPLLAYGFHALGRLRAQRDSENEQATLRQELRLRGSLNPDIAWRSSGARQLQQCWGPQGVPLGLREALPQALAEALAPQLQRAAPFDDVPVLLQLPAAPAQAWQVSGRPLYDTQGRYQGHVGQARALQPERQAALQLAGLRALLRNGPAPAAGLAWQQGQGFVLQELSPALQAAWPGAAPGQPLAACLSELPAPVATALQGLLQQLPGAEFPPQVQVAGWWLLPFQAAPGVTGLWLGLLPAPAAAAASGSSEAEQFSMTISHDLRAPIRVVEGFTRIVKEDYGRLLDRVGNDHLDRVLGAAARMNLMIDALLTLARLSTQPLVRQPVNLSQLAQYVVEDLKRGAPEREADFEIEPGLLAHGDPTLLRLVLENLLGNAWKYSARCPRTHIVLRSEAQGPLRGFAVQDNGVGFDMRSADRLFGLFQRLHSANDFAGHGVGLASVKRIVQRHGGDIWAEAEPGRGACFHFTLAP